MYLVGMHAATVLLVYCCYTSPLREIFYRCPCGNYVRAQVIEGTAKLHGCTADLKWSEQAYIPTINDKRMVAMVEAAAQKLVGSARWQRMVEPTMAAEDFGFLAGAASALQPVRLSMSFACR